MAAFDRVKSGIPEMDRVLDNIRLGDNVVWRVSSLEEFHLFLDPYLEQAIQDGRQIIYIRFASHPPLTEGHPEIKTVHIELSHRFETFTVEIHSVIAREGRNAFYVFDCLSELQTAWSTDLMMGNFFRVTCPFLFILDTVAFFPLIRGKHSFQAIAKIRDTTQLFLDVYSEGQSVYVRPDKVWNRYSETMFLPHLYEPGSGAFHPLLDGVQSSRFYQVLNRHQRPGEEQNRDAWDRFFNLSRQMYENGMDLMLITPGRVGTSSPELGVPTTFADISEFEVICEVAESKAGYNPELSYGSHIFQDLVEAQILYTAVFENEQTKQYHPEMLQAFPNRFADWFPDLAKLEKVIRICDVSDQECRVYNDLAHEKLAVVLD